MYNPFFGFGCWANGEHAWGQSYRISKNYKEVECRWCGRHEKFYKPKKKKR